jgi:hypothetical protein
VADEPRFIWRRRGSKRLPELLHRADPRTTASIQPFRVAFGAGTAAARADHLPYACLARVGVPCFQAPPTSHFIVPLPLRSRARRKRCSDVVLQVVPVSSACRFARARTRPAVRRADRARIRRRRGGTAPARMLSLDGSLPIVLPILVEERRRKTRSGGLVILWHFRSKRPLRRGFRVIPMVEMGGLEPPTPYMRSKCSTS